MPGPNISPLLTKLQNTAFHQLVTNFTGAPMQITKAGIEQLWADLDAHADVRKDLRGLANIALPPVVTDTNFEYRLPQVLTAIGILAQRVQVELVLSSAAGMKIACPPLARYCLKKKCKDNQSGNATRDRKSNGNSCCRPMRVSLDPADDWAKKVADFATQHRTDLNLSATATTHVFVNPGTLEILAISQD